jgi:predicted alpha/beta superfamily hydrolase
MKRLLALVLLGLVASSLSAQAPADVAQRKSIQSAILGEERTFWIRVPDNYARSGGTRYPVFYMTDGDAQMLHTVATIAFLERTGKIPQLIVVGVNNTDRTRDLTPSRATMPGRDGRQVEFPTAGGAGRFLDFFERELIPWVEANYRTEPFRVFAGHSFGGLFAINAFATRPDLFRGVIAASPTLQWDDDLPIRKTATLFDGRKELPATLYVTAGKEAEALVSSVKRFQKLTSKKAPKGLVTGFAFHEDEDHGSVVLRTHYEGLRTIFKDFQPPTDADGLIAPDWAAVQKHFEGVSRRYGYRVRVPEAMTNALGYQKLAQNRFDEAVAIFRANVEQYPHSANVYDSLGEAYEKSGRAELARAQYALAVEKSEGTNDPNAAVFKANLARVSK